MSVLLREDPSGQHRDLHGLEVAFADPLEAADGGQLTLGHREPLHKDGIGEVHAVHGDGGGEAHRAHSRDLLQTAGDELVGPGSFQRVPCLVASDLQADGEDVFGIPEARLYLPQRLIATDHQSRSHQDDHGQGHLGQHQGVPGSMPSPTGGGAPASLLQGVHQAGPAVAQSGEEPGEKTGEQRDSEGEEEDCRVQGDLLQSGEVR